MSSSNKRVRMGFIGAGWWATANHMPVLSQRDDVEFAGVCRLGKDELRQVKDTYGFAYATEDYLDLLDNCELDAVVVASPHTTHFEHANAVLDRDLHLLVEKPMTTDAAEARQLVRTADAKNLHIVVVYGWNYAPFVKQAKQLIDDGQLGPIEYVLCHMASGTRSLLSGEARTKKGTWTDALFQPASSTWADPKIAAGGYGYGQLTHALGLMFWLSDLQPTSVFSLMTAPGSKVDIYDAITVRFANGANGTVSGAGSVPHKCRSHVDIRLFGPEGMLLVDFERERMELRRYDCSHVVAEVEPDSGSYDGAGPPHNFVDLILGKNAENLSPGWAGMRTIELLDAAYRSSASGVEEQV